MGLLYEKDHYSKDINESMEDMDKKGSAFSECKEYFKCSLDDCITLLKYIIIRLRFLSETKEGIEYSVTNTTPKPKIFVVHGHNPIKDQLEALLLRWGFDPIILKDQANLGQTLIEKFEKNSDVQCAIVLLTPDDEGRIKGTNELKLRARQNVILELGYFYGKLGRNRVICLYKSDVEILSDISGIVYVPFKENLKREADGDLRKELKAMGLDIKD